MTDDRLALLELIEKRADADLIREMLGFAAGRVMELEVQACAGAATSPPSWVERMRSTGARRRRR